LYVWPATTLLGADVKVMAQAEEARRAIATMAFLNIFADMKSAD
jgi:hypothetical protein